MPGEASLTLRCEGVRGVAVGSRRREPVTCGIPFPRGLLTEPGAVELRDARGRPRTIQTRTLDRWPEGSVRWLLLDWLADLEPPQGQTDYRLSLTSRPEARRASSVLEVGGDDGRLRVDTGPARFDVEAGGSYPFARVEVGGVAVLDPSRSGLRLRDRTDRPWRVVLDRVEVEESGPVRVAIGFRGRAVAPGARPLVDLHGRFHFFTGSATVRCELAITNPRAAGHPGGIWCLGGAGSVYLREAVLVVTLAGRGSVRTYCSPEAGAPLAETGAAVEVYQESSGGENWRSRNHLDRHGELPLRFRGYRLRRADGESFGRRATPIVAAAANGHRVTAAIAEFWQNFPKSIAADDRGVVLGLFPWRDAGSHELQGGERKTHFFTLAFGEDGVSRVPLAWCRDPLLAHAEPSLYAAVAGAVPHLLPRKADPGADYLELVDQAISGDDTFEAKRERVDEFGWRHFGDLWADHEAVFADPAAGPLTSHYNNQYDAVAGCAIQFLRSADPIWHRLMDEMARHVIDIDLYHTDADKSAYNHGQFWHTVHYTAAGLSTHRSFPAAAGVAGGGPSAGHLYSTGLLLHHFLTGWRGSRRAVERLGRYVIDADDGAKSVFRFIDRGATGHVTLSGYGSYHGPGRAAANSLNALVDAHRLTCDRDYLAKAERLIGRCIHPDDDLEARELLDAERRWFYTMFLQSLAGYLEHKAVLGELDGRYAYARQSLLHYARFVLEHEHPFLDRPERLEYPTETWAAQDLRKCEVLQLAARHVEGEERSRMQERAGYFFRHSVSTLRSLPTRSLCRPVVLLLVLGYRQAYFERHADEREPPPPPSPAGFGRPEVFRSQKERVKRKLLALATAGLITLALLALLALLRGGGAA